MLVEIEFIQNIQKLIKQKISTFREEYHQRKPFMFLSLASLVFLLVFVFIICENSCGLRKRTDPREMEFYFLKNISDVIREKPEEFCGESNSFQNFRLFLTSAFRTIASSYFLSSSVVLSRAPFWIEFRTTSHVFGNLLELTRNDLGHTEVAKRREEGNQVAPDLKMWWWTVLFYSSKRQIFNVSYVTGVIIIL